MTNGEENSTRPQMMGEKDSRLFKEANRIVANAERDLGQLEYGQVVDLLADNTDWKLKDCEHARSLLAEDSRTRFRNQPEELIEDMENAFMPKEVAFIAKNGVPFLPRRLNYGDKYGRENCLTHDKSDPLIEFYDTRYKDSDFNGGQFVSRYYLSTLLQHKPDTGLNLHGGVPDWKIDAQNLQNVLQSLQTGEELTLGSEGVRQVLKAAREREDASKAQTSTSGRPATKRPAGPGSRM